MLVRKIVLPDGSDIQYRYDNNNHLNEVVRSDGKVSGESISYTYAYDPNLYPKVDGKCESTLFTFTKEGDNTFVTEIQKGLDGTYEKGERVKSNKLGNIVYRMDRNGKEYTYTYTDNMLATSSCEVEYRELSDGNIVTKSVPKMESTVYDTENMNPIEKNCGEQTITYEYANRNNPYLDDFPIRIIEMERKQF